MRPLEAAKIAAAQHPRQLRVVSALGATDMIMVEDRETGERRAVPNKRLLIAGNNLGVAFEMSDPGRGFESSDDE
jgi:hypothetical protein